MKWFKLFIKEWIISRMGGIPIWYLTNEELQHFYNRTMNELLDKENKDLRSPLIINKDE